MTPLATTVTHIVSSAVLVADIVIVALLILLGLPTHSLSQKIRCIVGKWGLVIGFIITAGATMLSIVYSSIIGFIPCELCWWQRVCMFPQVVLFASALYAHKKHAFAEAEQRAIIRLTFLASIILSSIGGAIALFQYYGQMFNPDLLVMCEVAGVSCAKLYFVSYGYITIPMMSLTSYLLLVILYVYYRKSALNPA